MRGNPLVGWKRVIKMNGMLHRAKSGMPNIFKLDS